MESKTTCIVKGCTEARYTFKNGTKSSVYCSTHKNEGQRNWYAKNPGKKREHNTRWLVNNEGHLVKNGDGYWMIAGVTHPASFPCGLTPLHRIILWDKLNGQNVPCAECGGGLIWGSKDKAVALAVDHVDGDKDNNSPENLDPVHLGCNTLRFHRARKAVAA